MKPRNWWNIDQVNGDKEKLSAITLFLKDAYNILNKGFTFSDNAKGAILPATFTAVNEDLAIRHGLDYVPTYFLVLNPSAAFKVYNGSIPGDKVYFYVRSDGLGTTDLFIF